MSKNTCSPHPITFDHFELERILSSQIAHAKSPSNRFPRLKKEKERRKIDINKNFYPSSNFKRVITRISFQEVKKSFPEIYIYIYLGSRSFLNLLPPLFLADGNKITKRKWNG